MRYKNLQLIFVLAFIIGCEERPVQKAIHGDQKSLKVQTSDMHKQWIQEDRDAIAAYVERRNWKMTETGTGTLYFIYETSDGEKGEVGKRATVDYEISLLDGTICYSSKDDGQAEVVIEKDDVESGVHEVLQLMRVGEKAAVILHPHRAHGLIGDMDKIGPQSVVIYNLELNALK